MAQLHTCSHPSSRQAQRILLYYYGTLCTSADPSSIPRILTRIWSTLHGTGTHGIIHGVIAIATSTTVDSFPINSAMTSLSTLPLLHLHQPKSQPISKSQSTPIQNRRRTSNTRTDMILLPTTYGILSPTTLHISLFVDWTPREERGGGRRGRRRQPIRDSRRAPLMVLFSPMDENTASGRFSRTRGGEGA